MQNESRVQQITQRLQAALRPDSLDVIDESDEHIGHAGAQTGKGHFAVIIRADEAFAGKSIVQQHQTIYAALGVMMQTDIHALRIEIK